MTVIRFPDRKLLEIYACTACMPNESGAPKSQAVEEPSQSVIAGEKQAVRHFALIIAEKLLTDREFNHAAPFLVDKIVRMLVEESRCIQDKP
ncbi:hypothetical protein [Pantoea sp. MQR6]|uniref:hypothetical protein n=1 Tax=Pantoea sp. MQR6 TaxID=2907307 RepID=UPI001FA98DF7|nr:hypothetical protein [Pantoea sp. MQR6]